MFPPRYDTTIASTMQVVRSIANESPELAARLEADPEKFADDMLRAMKAIAGALEPAIAMLARFMRGLTDGVSAVVIRMQQDAARYARGQRRKKPRGRRAKERSRLAWRAYFLVRRAA